MDIVAVPILDSEVVPWATARVIEIYRKTKSRFHLVNVQPAYPSHVSRFFSAKYLERIHREDGLRILAPVMKELDKAGVPHWKHVLVGLKVERIVDFVTSYHCSEVLLRDEAQHPLARLGFVSVDSEIGKALKALQH